VRPITISQWERFPRPPYKLRVDIACRSKELYVECGEKDFEIVKDYYQMIRGRTKGREREASGYFMEEQEWKNREIKR